MLRLRDVVTREGRTPTPESSSRAAMELFDRYRITRRTYLFDRPRHGG
jgi:hypothetical protein